MKTALATSTEQYASTAPLLLAMITPDLSPVESQSEVEEMLEATGLYKVFMPSQSYMNKSPTTRTAIMDLEESLGPEGANGASGAMKLTSFESFSDQLNSQKIAGTPTEFSTTSEVDDDGVVLRRKQNIHDDQNTPGPSNQTFTRPKTARAKRPTNIPGLVSAASILFAKTPSPPLSPEIAISENVNLEKPESTAPAFVARMSPDGDSPVRSPDDDSGQNTGSMSSTRLARRPSVYRNIGRVVLMEKVTGDPNMVERTSTRMAEESARSFKIDHDHEVTGRLEAAEKMRLADGAEEDDVTSLHEFEDPIDLEFEKIYQEAQETDAHEEEDSHAGVHSDEHPTGQEVLDESQGSSPKESEKFQQTSFNRHSPTLVSRPSLKSAMKPARKVPTPPPMVTLWTNPVEAASPESVEALLDEIDLPPPLPITPPPSFADSEDRSSLSIFTSQGNSSASQSMRNSGVDSLESQSLRTSEEVLPPPDFISDIKNLNRFAQRPSWTPSASASSKITTTSDSDAEVRRGLVADLVRAGELKSAVNSDSIARSSRELGLTGSRDFLGESSRTSVVPVNKDEVGDARLSSRGSGFKSAAEVAKMFGLKPATERPLAPKPRSDEPEALKKGGALKSFVSNSSSLESDAELPEALRLGKALKPISSKPLSPKAEAEIPEALKLVGELKPIPAKADALKVGGLKIGSTKFSSSYSGTETSEELGLNRPTSSSMLVKNLKQKRWESFLHSRSTSKTSSVISGSSSPGSPPRTVEAISPLASYVDNLSFEERAKIVIARTEPAWKVELKEIQNRNIPSCQSSPDSNSSGFSGISLKKLKEWDGKVSSERVLIGKNVYDMNRFRFGMKNSHLFNPSLPKYEASTYSPKSQISELRLMTGFRAFGKPNGRSYLKSVHRIFERSGISIQRLKKDFESSLKGARDIIENYSTELRLVNIDREYCLSSSYDSLVSLGKCMSVGMGSISALEKLEKMNIQAQSTLAMRVFELFFMSPEQVEVRAADLKAEFAEIKHILQSMVDAKCASTFPLDFVKAHEPLSPEQWTFALMLSINDPESLSGWIKTVDNVLRVSKQRQTQISERKLDIFSLGAFIHQLTRAGKAQEFIGRLLTKQNDLKFSDSALKDKSDAPLVEKVWTCMRLWDNLEHSEAMISLMKNIDNHTSDFQLIINE